MSPRDLDAFRLAVSEATNASLQMRESIERLTAGFAMRNDFLAMNDAVTKFAKEWESVMSPDLLRLREELVSFPKILGMDLSAFQREALTANEAITSLTQHWKSVMEPDLARLKESFESFPSVLGIDATNELLTKYAASLGSIDPKLLEGLETPLSGKLNALTKTALFPDVSSAVAQVAFGLGGIGDRATAQLTSLAAEASVAHLPWETLGERFGISARARFSLQHSTRRLQRRYADLTRVMPQSDEAQTDFVTDAPMSVLAHGQSLRVMTTDSPTDALVVGIRVDVVKATFEVVEDWLEDTNPQWAEMLRGARERAVLGGSDWPRHWASSYRQLFKNILHAAAPSDVVRQWATEKSDLDAKGFPKRRTKVRWLCRDEPKTQRRFLIEDIDSALGMLGVLEETVHEDNTDIVESEFHWLSLRLEKAMHDILRLWRRG